MRFFVLTCKSVELCKKGMFLFRAIKAEEGEAGSPQHNIKIHNAEKGGLGYIRYVGDKFYNEQHLGDQ